eukprot:TRINITY_DN4539_c0_g1_i2.p1 TRINITY_DN4539_c0_g1~~TRINITY_DN4539_c0_g1_i2.p1  ORF type:complete len:531 (+),score=137.32 TRINITY_DN4539_c0_g1_i2:47-1594(+)
MWTARLFQAPTEKSRPMPSHSVSPREPSGPLRPPPRDAARDPSAAPVVSCTPLQDPQTTPPAACAAAGGMSLCREAVVTLEPLVEVRHALLLHHDRDLPRALLGGKGLAGAAAVLSSRLNILLLAAPVAHWGHRFGLGDGVVFVASLVTIVPLAERLGFVTELLAAHTSDTVGGLLNATFGNALEVIVCWYALQHGLTRVVQLSLLGSILSNLLLVLGFSCFIGGLRWKIQTFKVVSGAVPTAMLMLATMGLLLPAALRMSGQNDDSSDEINFSRFAAGVMLVMYAGFLVFQLRTHTEEFESNDPGRNSPPPRSPSPSPDPEMQRRGQAAQTTEPPVAGADSPIEGPVMGLWPCLAWLATITLAVNLISERLVGTIEGFTKEYGVNSVFTSAVIIPVVGNAAEHAAAVLFAFRNRMDICMGIAVGSSTQIALLVLPGCVLLAWGMQKNLSLFFNGFETATLFSSVITVTALLHGGTSNWLVGLLLIGAYLIISCGFWVHELENLTVARGLPEHHK